MKEKLRKMRLTVFLLCITTMASIASLSYAQTTKLTVEMKNAKVVSILNEIENQSKFRFFFSNDVDVERKATIDLKDVTVFEILDVLFKDTNVKYEVYERQIALIDKSADSFFNRNYVEYHNVQQQRTITGTVTDENGEPLPGVSIVVKGTTQGTVTNADGNYSITNIPEDATLVFSFVGMQTQMVSIANRTTIDVVMEQAVTELEEVVAIGYGTQTRRDLTGAIGTVNEKNFNKGITISPEQMLQGKIAGVNITSRSGDPGGQQSITIRGPGSIRSGNDPLYVVDGVPLFGGASPDPVGLTGNPPPKNPLNFINPSDIESIDVLKDASAAAIYGARGSNGVILITTKKGVKGEAKVDYSALAGISSMANKLDLLTATEFKDWQNEHGYPENIIDPNVNTDWQDEVSRTAYSQQHNLSISNGSENSNYYASVSYLDEEGVLLSSEIERITGRINAQQNLWDDRLQLDLNLTASNVKDKNPPFGSIPAAGNFWTAALVMNPTAPVKNDDGTYFDRPSTVNPLANNSIYTSEAITNRVIGNLGASLELTDEFTYSINLGVDNTNTNRNNQIMRHTFEGIDECPDGKVVIQENAYRSMMVDNTLSYNFASSVHKLTVLAGHSYQNSFARSLSFGTTHFTTTEINAYYNPAIGGRVQRGDGVWPSGGARRDEIQSFFGRVNYILQDKYLLTASMRYDGSSRFGEANKYGAFPSVSAAWRISEENFTGQWDALHNLKLRAGWGRTGNQELPSKQSLASVTTSDGNKVGYPLFQDAILPGIVYRRVANPDLKWEVVTQTNIGLDFGFFGGKLFGSMNYFNKVTTDALLEVTVTDPLETAGGNTTWKNLKDTRIINNGIELELGYSKLTGPFTYSVGANATFINNEIKDLQGRYTSGTVSGQGMSGDVVQMYMSGGSVGSFYLPEFTGLNDEGYATFKGGDGSTKLAGDLTDEDYSIVGNALPDLMYNFFASFQYRNFDMNLNFNGVAGSYIFNNTALGLFRRVFFHGGSNIQKSILEEYPNESPNNISKPSTRWLEKGDYLRLNNASLGYTFDVSLPYIRNLRCSVTGQNLFVLTGYSGFDPEVNSDANTGGRTSYGLDKAAYPKARTILFGIDVSF